MSKFSDIDLKFIAHPKTKRVNNLDAKTAIFRSLNHILYTRKGERLYNHDFGVGIQDYVFEMNNFAIRDALKSSIQNQINRFETRVIFEDLVVDEHLHTIDISIYFRLKSEPQSLLVFEKTLKRIR
jgi:phage baseplate assembly protein W